MDSTTKGELGTLFPKVGDRFEARDGQWATVTEVHEGRANAWSPTIFRARLKYDCSESGWWTPLPDLQNSLLFHSHVRPE